MPLRSGLEEVKFSELLDYAIGRRSAGRGKAKVKKDLQKHFPSLKPYQIREILREAGEQSRSDSMPHPAACHPGKGIGLPPNGSILTAEVEQVRSKANLLIPESVDGQHTGDNLEMADTVADYEETESWVGHRESREHDDDEILSTELLYSSVSTLLGYGIVDEGWLGLSIVSRRLRRGWKAKEFGELGIWRPVRGHGKPPEEPRAFSRWVASGGEGRFLLFPDAVKSLLEGYGINPERVMVDLQDRKVTESDPGHSTKMVSVEGKGRRMVVLPDRYVRCRKSHKLGSAVGQQIGREARDQGGYR